MVEPTYNGYANLLQHLQHPNQRISIETTQATISHYLVASHASVSSPTQLTAIVISSPVWSTLSLKHLQILSSTFYHAILNTHSALEARSNSLFSGTVASNLAYWVNGVLLGLENGKPLLRMAITGGILHGLESLKPLAYEAIRHAVEEQHIVAFAECIESVGLPYSDDGEWGHEFQRNKDEAERLAELSLVIASQYFPMVPEGVFRALRLPALADFCLNTMQKTFSEGLFLRGLAFRKDQSGKLVVEPTSMHPVMRLASSDTYSSIAPISKLLHRTVTTLSLVRRGLHKQESWSAISQIVETMKTMTRNLEQSWKQCPLSVVEGDQDIAAESHQATAEIWSVLKTFLFSVVMISQAVVEAVSYMPPLSRVSGIQEAADASISVLEALSNLSFIIQKFGGVAVAPGNGGQQVGFKELRRTFYGALDILSSHHQRSEEYVQSLSHFVTSNPEVIHGHPFWRIKISQFLVCVEQLVPILSDTCLAVFVLPMCQPHLCDPLSRESFESAHSVMLAIFASHAGKPIAVKLVPGYLKVLLSNSREGCLSLVQLRMAYSSIVRCASTDVSREGETPLSRLCIETLGREAHLVPPQDDGHRLRLVLTLVSAIPCVAGDLLAMLLDELEVFISKSERPQKQRIIDAVYDEISERVGYAGKGFAMDWWYSRSRQWDLPNSSVASPM